MKLAAHDLSRLRWSILLSLLLALLGSCAVLGSLHFTRERREAHRQAQSERTEIQGKLAQIGFDGQGIQKKLARYNELMGHGYIGQENRLEWVEEIPRITKKRNLLDVRYELAPQQSVDNALGDGYDFMSSNMKLQMQLLHEEDLINFLADLRASVHAYIRINSCKVERLPRSVGDGGTVASLQADCSIDWITLRNKQ